jgi:hypothetical protein
MDEPQSIYGKWKPDKKEYVYYDFVFYVMLYHSN